MSVTAAQGFVAAGCHAGIKRRRFDMALVATEDRRPVAAAAVFTQNKFVAPPVILCRRRLAENGGRASAIVVNSGNANAGTGAAGLADAESDGCGGCAGSGRGRGGGPGLLDRNHRHALADGRHPERHAQIAKKLSVAEGTMRRGAF